MPTVSIERLPKSRVKCAVTLAPEEHEQSETKALLRLGQSIRLKGFRPGKAPLDILKRELDHDDVINEMLRQSVPSVLRDMNEKESLAPIAPPNVSITSKSPLSFTILVLERPKATLKKPEAFSVKTPREVTVSTEDIDRYMRKLLWHDRSETAEDRETQKGDLVLISVVASDSKGNPLPSLSRQNMRVVLGDDDLPMEMEKALLGMKKGEKKSVTVPLPSDAPEAKGKASRCTCELTLSGVWSFTLPPVTTEYLSTHFKVEKTPEQLRADIEKNLREGKEREAAQQRENEFFSAVAERTVVDLAPELIEHETELLMQKLQSDLTESHMSLEQWLERTHKTPQSLGAELRTSAEERLTMQAGIRYLLDTNNITVSDDEVSNAAARELATLREEGGSPNENDYRSGGKMYEKIHSEMIVGALLRHFNIA